MPLILKPHLDAEALVSLIISLKYQGFQCSVNVALIDYADIKGQGLDKYFFKPERKKVLQNK
ncbi:hypothetical protein EO92_11885 [Methanosarcina sp. 2.H.A.1B.4]|nr:hypothetical protein EO92_11885 [Methanosarcina sp. 2.H.A.1B.4]